MGREIRGRGRRYSDLSDSRHQNSIDTRSMNDILIGERISSRPLSLSLSLSLHLVATPCMRDRFVSGSLPDERFILRTQLCYEETRVKVCEGIIASVEDCWIETPFFIIE